jgi:hypothetical protein
MSKRMTLYFHDENIYNGLITMVGRGNISSFVENLIRPIILKNDTDEEMEQGYKLMAQDKEREKEAQAWVNGVISDVGNEPW